MANPFKHKENAQESTQESARESGSKPFMSRNEVDLIINACTEKIHYFRVPGGPLAADDVRLYREKAVELQRAMEKFIILAAALGCGPDRAKAKPFC